MELVAAADTAMQPAHQPPDVHASPSHNMQLPHSQSRCHGSIRHERTSPAPLSDPHSGNAKQHGLAQVHAARARGKPYTIVFVGVNGVGKSTSLAKTAYWLLQNDMKVGQADCILESIALFPVHVFEVECLMVMALWD